MTVTATQEIQQQVQIEIHQTLQDEPEINSVQELVDWKIEVWKRQFNVDYRIQALFNSLSINQKDNFYETVILNPYIPVVPFFNQILLLFSTGSTLYGGARGGGKTEASLIGALQYVKYSLWKVGIFRLTFPDLSVPGAIMDRALDWLHENPILEKAGISPHWDSSKKTFTFPNGSKVMFGHVQHEKDADKYQGSEFHKLIFDEAVQFTESKLTKIKGANRKKINDPLPLSIWYTGNPGGVSHDYFNDNFVKGPSNFINSKYTDNPYLNHEAYGKIFIQIKDSDPILYRQWKHGDWEAIPQGKLFKRKWFTDRLFDFINERIVKWLRMWDLAATKEEDPTKKGGPDWTAGGLFALGESGKVYLTDIQRFREDEDKVWENILNQAKEDGRDVIVRIEQEGAASGKMVIGAISRALPGYDCDGQPVTRTSKLDSARSWVTFIKNGGLKIKDGSEWLNTFLNEITVFPTKGIHDDQVDVISAGLNELFFGEIILPEGLDPFKLF